MGWRERAGVGVGGFSALAARGPGGKGGFFGECMCFLREESGALFGNIGN